MKKEEIEIEKLIRKIKKIDNYLKNLKYTYTFSSKYESLNSILKVFIQIIFLKKASIVNQAILIKMK